MHRHFIGNVKGQWLYGDAHRQSHCPALFIFYRTVVSWETDIALLAGQEIEVEQKELIEFPVPRNIMHNFVSMAVLFLALLFLIVGAADVVILTKSLS